ncbi:MAG TPA: TSUP family transporter [Polyangia bacterium]|nr:TSUP family transporter [Polyangia bacterium]
MTVTPLVVLLLSAAAFGAGFLNSIAGGGGLVSLPALLAAGLPPQLAIGTNKGQAVFGACASAASFWRERSLDRDRAALGFAAGFGGGLLGARCMLTIPPAPLRGIVMTLLLASAAVVLARRNIVPRPRSFSRAAARAALAGIGLGLGFYDGFFGPATGSILVVLFATVFGDSLTRASGNAKVVNLASNLAAFTTFVVHGTVIWRLALPMAAANVIGSTAGARLAVRKGDRLVRGVVLVVVLAVVVKLGFDLARGP